jgi:hypothetical protein
MTDKSPLRLAREGAGLSRKAMADKLGTTVHRYWHCEEPPFDGDPELMASAWSLLGQPPEDPPAAPQDTPRQEQRGQPRGEITWRCPHCDATQVTMAGVLSVGHKCPKLKSGNYTAMAPDRQ